MSKVVGLDFETANPKRNSACSIGIATLHEDGEIDVYHKLIRPPVMDFHHGCVSVHGITPDMVINLPNFKDIWSEIRPLLDGNQIWAHNAPFERSVMKALGEEYGLETNHEIDCTIQLAKRMFPNLETYNLSAVMDHLGFAIDHHDAGDDAWASVKIVQAAQMLVERGEWSDPMIQPWVTPNRLRGRVFAMTGEFEFGPKSEVLRAMEILGVILETRMKRETPYLLIGDKGKSLGPEYDKAMKYIRNGGPIRMVRESVFWEVAQRERSAR